MEVVAKVLLAAGTLGISCVGTPWLFRQINSSSSQNKVRPLPVRPSLTPAVKSTLTPLSRSAETAPKSPEELSIQAPAIPVPTEVKTTSPQPPVKTNAKNCSVENRVDDLETLLSNNFVLSGRNLVDTSNFVKVNCSKTISDGSSKMPSDWEGLFPKILFENIEGIVNGGEIEIKTQTSEDSSKYKTTFKGSHFHKEVLGEWSKTDLNTEEKTVTEVRIISFGGSSEKIYLMFKK